MKGRIGTSRASGILAISLIVLSASVLRARNWTDDSGRYHVDGDFVSLDDGVVRIHAANGKTIEIPLEKLSAADQAVVKKMENPFKEVKANDPRAKEGPKLAKPGKKDPIIETQEYCVLLGKRLTDAGTEVAGLGTDLAREQAMKKIRLTFGNDVQGRRLTFVFNIQGVSAGRLYPTKSMPPVDGTSIRVSPLEGIDGMTSNGMEYVLPISQNDGAKITPGDKLIMSGVASLEWVGGPVGGGHNDWTPTRIGGFERIAGFISNPTIALSNVTYKIDPAKN